MWVVSHQIPARDSMLQIQLASFLVHIHLLIWQTVPFIYTIPVGITRSRWLSGLPWATNSDFGESPWLSILLCYPINFWGSQPWKNTGFI